MNPASSGCLPSSKTFFCVPKGERVNVSPGFVQAERAVGSDGRRKAILEDAIKSRQGQGNTDGQTIAGPWQIGHQISEQNLLWNDELTKRLVQRIAARELNLGPEQLQNRLSELLIIMPKLQERVQTMKPAVLAKLCMEPSKVAERLVELRAIFPSANVELMALRDTNLLLARSIESTREAAAQLKEFLPAGVGIDKLCQEYPSMLDVASFKSAIQEVQRLMPNLDLVSALRANPEIIFSTQRAKHIIPYDAVPGSSE